MILEELSVTTEAFRDGTGWAIEPQGACRGDVCVPLGGAGAAAGDRVDVALVAERLGMPLVRDEEHRLWALGPASLGGRFLLSAEAPDLTLPDLDGNPFDLSSLRGRKVVLVAWAPY